MQPSPSSVLILAGGSARRMGGGDKPMADIGGQPILARIIAAVSPADIAISANGNPARFAPFGVPVLPDGPFAEQGPLAGVLAGLEWAAERGAATLLTIPGDTPFIPRGLAAALAPAPSCAASGGRVHHLVALWPLGCRFALRTALAAPGPRDVRRFADKIGMRHVNFPIIGYDPFMNVNTMEDLAVARALARNAEGLS
jgi:molybdenum cofactor guanylyltransferase